LFTLLFQIQFS